MASIYVATDSRITWRPDQRWDQGRKVFACLQEPHIFGYWGDVLFPALAIPMLVDQIDRRLLTAGHRGWHETVRGALRSLWHGYPDGQRQDLGIVHATRMGSGLSCRFALTVHMYESKSERWAVRPIEMPTSSSILHVAGSGAKQVREAYDVWQSSTAADTSRAVYSAFCQSIGTGADRNTGGAPQLVGLYRVGAGRLFGTIHGKQRYFAGARLSTLDSVGAIEWRNDLFERIDGNTGRRVRDAKKHERF